MYELSRVRLHAVGPKGARYQDVTLDLRRGESGEPSPASVLFLENGGGKTVLVRLIFSVLLPGRRQVVGTSSSKVLEKFVLAGDVSHVALEWQDTRTGQLLVTGKASEWSGHVVSADSTRLNERWYTLRPTDAVGLATLPFTSGGRIVSLSGFYDRLDEAQKTDPSLQVTWERNHGDWTEHLQRLHLDPALFGYQRKMNAGEGEAADAFTFKTDEAFVDWLLTAILPEEEPASLGEVVSEYGTQLASRGELMAERAFVEGALERLGPLVQAAGEKDAAATMHAEAQADVERLVLGLSAREGVETARLSLLTSQLGQVEARERLLDQEARRLNQVVLELRRLVAKLRWDAAKTARESLERERDDARLLLRAWNATAALVKYDIAHDAAETIRDVVRRQELEAEPELRIRGEAAARLARALLATAGAADEAAGTAKARGDELAGKISTAGEEERAAIRDAEGANARIEQASKNIGQAQSAVQAAAAAGLLTDGQDVSETADLAAADAAEAESRLGTAMERTTALAAEREQADADLNAAQAALATRTKATEGLREQIDTAQQAAARLTGTTRLAELLGSEEITLDQDAAVLADLLDGVIEATRGEADELRLKAIDDGRVLEALGNGGLLPPGEDVTKALGVLSDERVTSWSGWQYLARMPADERQHMLARHPHLVDGIVLNSGDDLPKAHDVLTAARLLPRTVIAIGTTAAITDSGPDAPAGIGFIIPPNPAMYDEARAEEERQEIQQRAERRSARITKLEDTVRTDQALRAKLAEWQRAYPPGRLDELAAQHGQAEAARLKAQEAERGVHGRVTDLAREDKELRRELPVSSKAARELANKAVKLRALADEHAKVTGWQDEIRKAREDRTQAEQLAKRKRDDGTELGRQQLDAYREADSQHRTAEACRQELGGVFGGGAVDESMPVPEAGLESLRAAYQSAAAAYEKVAVGATLLAEVDRLERAEAQARSEREGIDPQVLDHASGLLLTPEGSDASARAEAKERAGRRADALEQRVIGAAGLEGELKRAFEEYIQQERSLEPYGKPEDIPHGEQLIERATSDWDKARAGLEEVRGRAETLNQQLTATRDLVRDFAAVRESLAVMVSPVTEGDASPFEGTVDTARSRRDSVRDTLGEASRLLNDATDQVRRAADALARHAADERFESLAAPVRRQLNATERDRLPDFAAEWEAALRPRFRVLSDELEQIERHRTAIVERLQGMVLRALGRLRAAQRASRLPADLADWSGLEFLRISFTQPEDAVLAERLGQVLDEVTAAVPGKTTAKRDGMSILLSGVKVALQPRGVRVEILKPDAVLRDERIRVGEIGDVFSGGQLLTTAIILYCTMAWLRAGERGHAQRQHAGVLFLDNPIGRASAGYLLELQLTVARKLGVQLIYTTGLFDTNALSVFPLIVRLRNDADLRAGMKYLRVDEMIRPHLPALLTDDAAMLTASRLFARPGSPDGTG